MLQVITTFSYKNNIGGPSKNVYFVLGNIFLCVDFFSVIHECISHVKSATKGSLSA